MAMTLAPDALLGLIDAAICKHYPDPSDDTTLVFIDENDFHDFQFSVNAMIYKFEEFENFDGGCFIANNSKTTGMIILFMRDEEGIVTLEKNFDIVV